jgi:hypothetical protein
MDISLVEDTGRLAPDDSKVFEVTMTVRGESELAKLRAWKDSDAYERAQAIRAAELAQCIDSLKFCVKAVLERPSGGTARIAQFLASLYNGDRVRADVSGIGALDGEHFQHLMNVLRLCFETHREPHSFFKNGNAIFEQIIADYGLEKRRRRVA